MCDTSSNCATVAGTGTRDDGDRTDGGRWTGYARSRGYVAHVRLKEETLLAIVLRSAFGQYYPAHLPLADVRRRSVRVNMESFLMHTCTS